MKITGKVTAVLMVLGIMVGVSFGSPDKVVAALSLFTTKCPLTGCPAGCSATACAQGSPGCSSSCCQIVDRGASYVVDKGCSPGQTIFVLPKAAGGGTPTVGRELRDIMWKVMFDSINKLYSLQLIVSFVDSSQEAVTVVEGVQWNEFVSSLKEIKSVTFSGFGPQKRLTELMGKKPFDIVIPERAANKKGGSAAKLQKYFTPKVVSVDPKVAIIDKPIKSLSLTPGT